MMRMYSIENHDYDYYNYVMVQHYITPQLHMRICIALSCQLLYKEKWKLKKGEIEPLKLQRLIMSSMQSALLSTTSLAQHTSH